MKVLFIHAAWPSQFSPLHRYFQKTKLADSLCLVKEEDRNYYQQHDKDFPGGVIGYLPDGNTGPNTYYYSGLAERNARHALPILRACQEILKTQTLDVIVAHGVLGPPQMLFDEIDVPIISYVEYPSFRHYQWDRRYPPEDAQRYSDTYNEMINYYAALKSDCVIAPSAYAKSMFPQILQEKIVAQMDAFEPDKLSLRASGKVAFEKTPGLVYVGFSASALSSEKGFEQFIRISKRLSELNTNIRYVIIGDPKGVSYCFESLFLEKQYGKNSSMSFKDHLFLTYGVDDYLYICTGRLDTASFSATIHQVDFFLYPLQFGSANWGVYELLLRGKIVIGSNRCFVPEVITHGENGFLVDYDDIEGWATLANEIALNPQKYSHIGTKAALSGEALHTANVARQYLKIFSDVIARRKSG